MVLRDMLVISVMSRFTAGSALGRLFGKYACRVLFGICVYAFGISWAEAAESAVEDSLPDGSVTFAQVVETPVVRPEWALGIGSGLDRQAGILLRRRVFGSDSRWDAVLQLNYQPESFINSIGRAADGIDMRFKNVFMAAVTVEPHVFFDANRDHSAFFGFGLQAYVRTEEFRAYRFAPVGDSQKMFWIWPLGSYERTVGGFDGLLRLGYRIRNIQLGTGFWADVLFLAQNGLVREVSVPVEKWAGVKLPSSTSLPQGSLRLEVMFHF